MVNNVRNGIAYISRPLGIILFQEIGGNDDFERTDEATELGVKTYGETLQIHFPRRNDYPSLLNKIFWTMDTIC